VNAGSGSIKKTPPEGRHHQPVDLLVGRTIDHRYYLESRLGMGGMGTVYRAKRLHIGDTVAIKILNSEHTADTRAVERLHREAKVCASLRHPNTVTVYDYGISEDQLVYFVMELVEGDDLRRIILQNGQMSQTVAAEILIQICAALKVAHAKNVVHRDLKPENILVQTTPNGQHVKVLDFGIASLRNFGDDKLTQTGSVVGTPHYMSPEQCMGGVVDQRSDIYSLGIILFEMLAGTAPFNSTTPTAIAVQQVNNTPPPLRELNPNVSPEVEAVVMHALRKSPEERPQSASALAQELIAALNGDQPMSFAQKVTDERAAEMSNFGSSRRSGKRRALIPLSISLVMLFAVSAAFGLWRQGKNDGNKAQSTAIVVTQDLQAAAPTPQAKVELPINPIPDKPAVKPVADLPKKPSRPSSNHPVKKKAVETKKTVVTKKRAETEKDDDDEKEDRGFYRERRMMLDNDHRYRRYRHHSFGPDDRDRFYLRRRSRWYYR
jgi:serine/threonine protein kinase